MTLAELSIRNAVPAEAKDLIEAAFAPLITLTASDNEPALVARSMPIYVRGIRELTRECDFVASTDAIDSYDEVVDQQNWVLERFMANPVALWAHQSRELPIGTVTRCEVVNGRLECTIQFSTEDHESPDRKGLAQREGEGRAGGVRRLHAPLRSLGEAR